MENKERRSKASAMVFATTWGRDNLKTYRGLSRKESTILLHYRTGFIGLGDFLLRVKAVTTKACPYCKTGDHTVAHLLRECTSDYMQPKRERLMIQTGHGTDQNLDFMTRRFPKVVAQFAINHFQLAQFSEFNWQEPPKGQKRPPDDDHSSEGPPAKMARV